MQVGLQLVFQRERYERGLELAVLAEQLGFDALWCFEEGAMCPDGAQVLAYLAARTRTIRLGAGTVVQRASDPLRVVATMALLDHLSHGRMLCGLDPRGPREQWEEAAETLLRGLDTGVVETDGPAFAPSRFEVRPRPARGVRDRLYMVATSPEAIDAAAELGARLFVRTGRPIERHALEIDRWRSGFREHRGSEPAPPVLVDRLYVHQDPREAERVARRCLDSFDTQLWGTPEQLVDRYRHRVEVIGEFFTNLVFSPPGLDLDAAQASMCLFAHEVLPELHRLRVPVAAA